MSKWAPTASLDTLRRRAEVIQKIRRYFAEANVLEVDTPVLSPWGAPDPAINSFIFKPLADTQVELSGFLQTSPEFAMKRLLAAGSGDIFQLCHAFRAEQSSRHHLAEFTLLEWYRVGFDHHQLMDDVETLVGGILRKLNFTRRPYADIFRADIALDPHTATTTALSAAAGSRNIELGCAASDRSTILDALFADLMLREQSVTEAVFVYDFPIEQAAYARIEPGPPAHAQRFELVIGGIEIANGYHEVVDLAEQQARFRQESLRRRELGLPKVGPDPLFLAALESGLPSCAGVALGVDRLMMLYLQADSVAASVSFDSY